MSSKTIIIDCRLGNLFSVQHACQRVGLDPVISSDSQELLAAERAILPGVGAFGDAMRNLEALGLSRAIHQFVGTGRPLMGICLGMQLLFDSSEEFGSHRGLGILPGRVRKLQVQQENGQKLKVPHIGWNGIHAAAEDRLAQSPLSGLPSDVWMYFVHSFHSVPDDASHALTWTPFGEARFCSSVMWRNVFATQFHPEKSAETGLQIYRNWASLASQGTSRE